MGINTTRCLAFCLAIHAWVLPAAGQSRDIEPWRSKLYVDWHLMPVPPITQYTGPFGAEARAFIGPQPASIAKEINDWQRQGTYNPAQDPRKINLAFEDAVLEDWRRMGYNTAYKGNSFTFRSGRWLKQHGMLGAIDQTVWATRSEPPLSFDGKPGERQNEACGSFFVRENFDAGVKLLSNYAKNFGEPDMLKVGDVYVTSSWDELGIRTRKMIDYRPQAIEEYRKFLSEVWFGDAGPDRDTNGDGRTYNSSTGESLTAWSQVVPPNLAPRFYDNIPPSQEKWQHIGAYKLWIDFHRYFTFEFFRRTSDGATELGGKRIECYPFPIAFIMWPGMNAFFGLSSYWNARLSPIITVEQCWPDAPPMPLAYAQGDHLVRKYHNLVMGWSWFFFGDQAGDMYDGPGDIERALARMMGHTADGIHHWLYSPLYRSRHVQQRAQLAYWHNFLGTHYATFLARSSPPRAEVALLLPDWTGYYYRIYGYPKMDYAYTSAALNEAQIPYEILAEEELELEDDALKPFKVLYVVGSEWTTPTIRRRIEKFIAGGGQVFANADSLSLDLSSGKRTDFLAKSFGVGIDHKYKVPFYPSVETFEEEAWSGELMAADSPMNFQSNSVHKPHVYSSLWQEVGGKPVPSVEGWKKVDLLMSHMPLKGRGGMPQTGLDLRKFPQIEFAKHVAPRSLDTHHEIVTGKVTAGKPIAWYDGKVCGVETDRTVWFGIRPGMSLHALAPRMSLSRTTEPCNPFLATVSSDYATHKSYVDLLAYAARKAGVHPLVTARSKGDIPCNLEVLPRVDRKGNLMVVLINHDQTQVPYDVTVDPTTLRTKKIEADAVAWDLLRSKPLKQSGPGKFRLEVPAFRVAVFYLGSEQVLGPIKTAQAKLDARDLSVPAYFKDRPELNKPLFVTPIPAD